MIELKVGKRYNIQQIEGENYAECPFVFGVHIITEVDEQYFQSEFVSLVKISSKSFKELLKLEGEWWDSEGFSIKEIRN